MTKQEMLEKYQGLLEVKGDKETSGIILNALSFAYDEGYVEGLRFAIKTKREVNRLFIHNAL